MWMLLIALLLTLLKYLGLGPLAGLSWWWLLLPYGLTVAWWTYADLSGLTQRRIAVREEARRRKRIDRQKQALGMRRPRR